MAQLLQLKITVNSPLLEVAFGDFSSKLMLTQLMGQPTRLPLLGITQPLLAGIWTGFGLSRKKPLTNMILENQQLFHTA